MSQILSDLKRIATTTILYSQIVFPSCLAQGPTLSKTEKTLAFRASVLVCSVHLLYRVALPLDQLKAFFRNQRYHHT